MKSCGTNWVASEYGYAMHGSVQNDPERGGLIIPIPKAAAVRNDKRSPVQRPRRVALRCAVFSKGTVWMRFVIIPTPTLIGGNCTLGAGRFL
jgi:hypothetical protein